MWEKDGAANFFHQYVYTATAEARGRLMRQRLDAVIKHLRKGKVLDVGCSIGLFLDALNERGFEACGVEVTPFAVDHCRKKGRHVYDEPIEKLKLPKETFQAVFAWEVIAHLSDVEAFFTNAYHALRPGAHLFLTTPNAASLEYDTIWEDGRRRHPNLKPHVFLQIFSPRGLEILLERSGFVIREFTTPGTMDLENIRDAARREKKRFNCRFFNDLFLDGGEESAARRIALQDILKRTGYSGHAHVVCGKPPLAE